MDINTLKRISLYELDESAIADGRVLVYRTASGKWECEAPGGGGQAAMTLYSYNGNSSCIGYGHNNTSFNTATNEESFIVGVDVDLLNTCFPGGWNLYWLGLVSTNGATATCTLDIQVLDETNVQTVANRSIGLTNGSSSNVLPAKSAALNTGTVPTTGLVRLRVQHKITRPAAEIYYLSNWQLIVQAV